jgi:hypothetical protein
MIDVSTETLLTFAEFAASLPNRPNISTVHRWRLRGCRGVKLESIMLGGTRFTSQEAGQRFFNKITAVADGTAQPEARTSTQRERAISRAEAELEAAGI